MRSAIANTSVSRWDTKIDRHAPGAQVPQVDEQPLGLALGQGRGGLVEDEQPGTLGECPGDDHQLLGGQVERAHACLDRHADTEVAQAVARGREHARPVDHAAATSAGC